MAQDAAVCTGHGLVALGEAWTFAWSGWGDTLKLLLALTAARHGLVLLHVLVDQTAAGSAHSVNKRLIRLQQKRNKLFVYHLHAPPVGSGVVRQASPQSQALDHVAAAFVLIASVWCELIQKSSEIGSNRA